MSKRILLMLLLVGLFGGSSAFSAPEGKKASSGRSPARSASDLKTLMQKELEAWETLDPANAAPFYAKEANLAFFDITPLKYTGWAEYAEGVKKVFANAASLKFSKSEDAQTYQRGNLAWATATLHAELTGKDGSKLPLDGRWTLIWEKRGKDWLIVHEHYSAPIAMPETAGQPLYKRLGGYDALAAVTDDFIGRLVNDPQLAKFFAGHSTDSLHHIRQLVVDQLCNATGGPCFYIGRDMKTSHAGLGITENDWQSAANHLVETLDKFKVPPKEKQEVLDAISGLKKDIVQ